MHLIKDIRTQTLTHLVSFFSCTCHWLCWFCRIGVPQLRCFLPTAETRAHSPGGCGICDEEIGLTRDVFFCVLQISLTSCHSRTFVCHLGLLKQTCMKQQYQWTRCHPTLAAVVVPYVPRRGDTRIYRLAARGCT
jgi:hypothetical protein